MCVIVGGSFVNSRSCFLCVYLASCFLLLLSFDGGRANKKLGGSRIHSLTIFRSLTRLFVGSVGEQLLYTYVQAQ